MGLMQSASTKTIKFSALFRRPAKSDARHCRGKASSPGLTTCIILFRRPEGRRSRVQLDYPGGPRRMRFRAHPSDLARVSSYVVRCRIIVGSRLFGVGGTPVESSRVTMPPSTIDPATLIAPQSAGRVRDAAESLQAREGFRVAVMMTNAPRMHSFSPPPSSRRLLRP
jgi:hypothetical protein